ncbi:MAG: DUF4097 family beta strand repeat-containing protein [Faecalimonas sp.]|nr:DUF4097 family beta strand repeat-containing protein [Faecalimonas sp.]
MKKFTKIALILVVVLLSVGLVSVIGSFAMGLTWDSLGDMVNKGKLSFDLDDIIEDNEFTAVQEDFHSLDIEFGYGTLEIKYGDVEKLQIKQKNVDKYRCYVEEGALHIEGNQKIKVNNSNYDGEITIVIPKNMVFQEVDLEVGAGKADVANLKANQVDIELGAGEVNVTGLDTKKFEAKTGAGKLYAELVGKQNDYSYELECGIGQLKIGDSSYSGLGTEQNITNPGAERFADIECGVGEIIIKFQEQ